MRCVQAVVVATLLVSTACDRDSPGAEPAELPFDLLCPGAPACASAEGPLLVGVGVRDITPTITETFFDCGLDQLCEGDTDYPGPDSGEGNAELDGHPTMVSPPAGAGELIDDVNGNGYFDAVWIAGYGHARAAIGVHDPLNVRALVLRQGETTLALVAADVVGYFYDEVERIRAALDPALGVDLVLVAASHTHEGPDTIGMWGFDLGSTGVDAGYMEMLRQAIIDAIADAIGSLQEARAIAASGPSGVHPDPAITQNIGINNLIKDGRDPVVIDQEIRVIQFVEVSDPSATIATLVNWSNHPESLCSRNRFISSDFVHYLREAIENGIDRGDVVEPGLGGTAVFVNGALGGMQSPGRVRIVDLDGTELVETCRTTNDVNDSFFDRPRAFGQLAALDALRVLRTGGEEMTDASLSFVTKTLKLPVENWGYHAMFLTEIIYGRQLYDFDRSQQISLENLPWVKTEVAVVNLGSAQAITVPGELLPEWFLGGYDGSATGPAQQLIDSWFNRLPQKPVTCSAVDDCTGKEYYPGRFCQASRCICHQGICLDDDYNPPDLSQAPGPPYLRDTMTRPLKMVWGLTPDELGYIVPLYNFKLDELQPYVKEAPGDHYEETNSIGDNIGPAVKVAITSLLDVLP